MIYTKTGDKGTTSLVGGSRVEKDDARVEAYGTVDELNSQLALVAELMGHDAEDYAVVKTVQRHLFTIQTLLATEDPVLAQRLPQLEEKDVAWLEQQIDTIDHALPKLRTFVLPGGTTAGAQCHVARCVCRRAERRVVGMLRLHPDAPVAESQTYLNRLSDWLFVLGRKWTLNDGEECFVSVG